MKKKYVVSLSKKERIALERIVRSGECKAYLITHAHILLKADTNGPDMADQEIADMFHCHQQTVHNVRKRYLEYGVEGSLKRKTRDSPPITPILDGEKEARLIALSCQQPPEGYSRWTCKLLSERLVELEIVDSISRKTVERTLKKRTQTPS